MRQALDFSEFTQTPYPSVKLAAISSDPEITILKIQIASFSAAILFFMETL